MDKYPGNYSIGICKRCKDIGVLKNGICLKCQKIEEINPFKDIFEF